MKKIMSVILAVIVAVSCIAANASAAGNSNEDVAFLGEETTVYKLSEFAGKENLTVCAFDENIVFENDITLDDSVSFKISILNQELAAKGLTYEDVKPTFIIYNQNEKAKQCVSPRKYGEGQKLFNWFSFDSFDIFGKTILTFFYEPILTDTSYIWLNKLIEETDADYLYFDTLSDYKQVYVKVTGELKAEDINSINNGESFANPGFFRKLMIKLCEINMWEKSVYDNCPGGKGFSWLYSLLSSFLSK